MGKPLVQDWVRGRAEPNFVDAVQDLIARTLERVPEPGLQERMRFELAVVEVVSNAVQHTPAGFREVELDFGIEVHPGRLLARLWELGADPFDPRDVEAAMPAPEAEAESGRGLAVARQLLSTITCERLRSGSNLWTLIRRHGQQDS